jgi:hypothetical protein
MFFLITKGNEDGNIREFSLKSPVLLIFSGFSTKISPSEKKEAIAGHCSKPE